MSDIRLHVELNNDWREIELGPATEIARTRQVNDLGEAENRQADFTNQFSVPKTQANRITFENADQVNSNSDIPYSIIRAKLTQYGRETLGFIIFEEGGADYQFTFYTGNADFFFQLEGVTLQNDIDFDDLDHWCVVDIIKRLATEQSGPVHLPGVAVEAQCTVEAGDILYPLIDYNTRDESGGPIDADAMTNSTRDVFTDRLFPGIPTKQIVERILAYTGYTADGEFFNLPEYEAEYIPFSNESFQRNERIAQRTNRSLSLTVPLSIPPVFPSNGLVIGSGNWTVTQWHPSPFRIGNTFFLDKMTVAVDLTITIQNGNTAVRLFNISVNGNFCWQMSVPVGGSTTASFTKQVNLAGSPNGSPDSIYVVVFPANGNLSLPTLCTVTSASMSVAFVENLNTTETNTIYHGPDYNSYGLSFLSWCTASSALPNMTAKEFLKDLAKRYGITFVPDPASKKISFRIFNELEQNKPDAPNWDHMVVDEPDAVRTEFRFGDYAQTNNAEWKDDDTVPTGLGNGSITIQDTNLEIEGTIITQSFAASETVERLQGLEVMSIPKFAIDGNGDAVLTQKTEPRIGFIYWQTPSGGSFSFYGSDPMSMLPPPIVYSGPVATTYFISENQPFTMSFSAWLLPTYYPVLIGILQRPKKATIRLRMTTEEFLTFDHFMPVYFNKSGQHVKVNGYFYVNVAPAFVAGQPIAAELILL